ncbi:2-dehydro-3-deoxygalactonokinase [Aliifodinibius sp. S!AR15-10]|uniref:2-dehydro-3-deoxygalactonokinase n=1 Tax=Aliifodinibius sp. S!AR15-10 TaxID=2950437 RepID=UPI00285C0EE1|nr:2-dehydro-3-deoxygalactonokinase [Aliifodinibius sp. S!AR15-10]MDR8391106.1 2-dehydro-3-deoxygalactonokinase [Aliifodinibius sp. S!AR15-10]
MNKIFAPHNYFMSCDWGTSSFRLSLVDRQSRATLQELSTSGGVKKLYNQWQQSNDDTGHTAYFLNYFGDQIKELEGLVEIDTQNIPIIISGMASSSIGMKELPYGMVPFSLKNPDLPSEVLPATEQFAHDVLLVSGIQTPDDVMRGEEIQLLGLAAEHNVEDCICVMPGTHSKHVFIRDSEVISFKTFMTGEVFELLTTQSVLAGSVNSTAKALDKEAFQQGVKESQKTNLLHAIFGIRTNDLLKGIDKQTNFDLLSGMVIGHEIAELATESPSRIYIVGSGPLTERYKTAMQTLDLNPIPVENTDQLTLQGHINIINQNS